MSDPTPTWLKSPYIQLSGSTYKNRVEYTVELWDPYSMQWKNVYSFSLPIEFVSGDLLNPLSVFIDRQDEIIKAIQTYLDRQRAAYEKREGERASVLDKISRALEGETDV